MSRVAVISITTIQIGDAFRRTSKAAPRSTEWMRIHTAATLMAMPIAPRSKAFRPIDIRAAQSGRRAASLRERRTRKRWSR